MDTSAAGPQDIAYVVKTPQGNFAAFTKDVPPLCREAFNCTREDCSFTHPRDKIFTWLGITKLCKFCASGVCRGTPQSGFYCVPPGCILEKVNIEQLPQYDIPVPKFKTTAPAQIRRRPPVLQKEGQPRKFPPPLSEELRPIGLPAIRTDEKPPVHPNPLVELARETAKPRPKKQKKPKDERNRKELTLLELAAVQTAAIQNLEALLAEAKAARDRNKLFGVLLSQSKLSKMLMKEFYSNDEKKN